MAKKLQLRRGTTSQHSSFTGAVGEVTVDTDKKVVVVHDESTAGGFPMARYPAVAGTVGASELAQVDANKDITGFRNITLTGELDAATGDFSGNVDIDGTCEADAYTVNGTALDTHIAGVTVTNATNAAHVSVADNESTNENNLIPFIEDASATGNVGLESDGDFHYNPSTGLVSAPAVTTTGNVTVGGTLTVNGTTTTVNSTTLTVDDKNIELGSVSSPSDTTADGGGITLKGASDKTILWTNATDSWDFNQKINAATGLTVTGQADFNGLLTEACTITAGKLSDNLNQDLANGNVFYFTTAESTTSTPNLRWNSSTTLASKLSTGDVLTVTIITTAAAAGFSAQLTIDGSAVTENWDGGTAPAAGGSSGLDIYTYTIVKTSCGFTVIGNLTKTSA